MKTAYLTGKSSGKSTLQVALGTAAYSGTCGVMKDGDEAYRWLSRAANKLANLPPSLNTGLPNGFILLESKDFWAALSFE